MFILKQAVIGYLGQIALLLLSIAANDNQCATTIMSRHATISLIIIAIKADHYRSHHQQLGRASARKSWPVSENSSTMVHRPMLGNARRQMTSWIRTPGIVEPDYRVAIRFRIRIVEDLITQDLADARNVPVYRVIECDRDPIAEATYPGQSSYRV